MDEKPKRDGAASEAVELGPSDSVDTIEAIEARRGKRSGPSESVDTIEAVEARRGKRSMERPATLLKRTNSKHLVESSLEEFVAKARGNVLDVSSFAPETREQTLVREIDDLKQKLADAQARIAARAAMEEPRDGDTGRTVLDEARDPARISPSVNSVCARAAGVWSAKRVAEAPAMDLEAAQRTNHDARAISSRRSWGAIAAAFVVGAASMFAVSFVMPRGRGTRADAPPITNPVPATDPTAGAAANGPSSTEQPPVARTASQQPGEPVMAMQQPSASEPATASKPAAPGSKSGVVTARQPHAEPAARREMDDRPLGGTVDMTSDVGGSQKGAAKKAKPKPPGAAAGATRSTPTNPPAQDQKSANEGLYNPF